MVLQNRIPWWENRDFHMKWVADIYKDSGCPDPQVHWCLYVMLV